MVLGFNNKINYPHQSIADMGGRRLLKMPGSLKSYIDTGNPYDSSYYNPPYKKQKKKSSFLNNIPKYTGMAIGLAGILTGVSFLITGKIKIKDIPVKLKNEIQNFNLKDKTTTLFSNIKGNKFTNFIQKQINKIKKPNINNNFKKIDFSKISNNIKNIFQKKSS